MSESLPLAEEACRPLPRGTPPVTGKELEALRARLDPAWRIASGPLLVRAIEGEYPRLARLAARIAALAQEHDHHPDLALSYGRLEVAWSTHSVGGLSRNDFVLAARIDRWLADSDF